MSNVADPFGMAGLIFGLSPSYSRTLIVRSILAVSMSGVIAIRILFRNGSFIKHFYLYRLMKKVNRVFGRVLSEK